LRVFDPPTNLLATAKGPPPVHSGAAGDRIGRGGAVKEGTRAIKALKYAYFRHLDLKEFDDLGALLTADATASYEDAVGATRAATPSSAFSRRRSAIQASSPSTTATTPRSPSRATTRPPVAGT